MIRESLKDLGDEHKIELVEVGAPKNAYTRIAEGFIRAVAKKRGKAAPLIVWSAPRFSERHLTVGPGGIYDAANNVICLNTKNGGLDAMWNVIAHEIAHATGIDRLPFSETTVREYQDRYLELSSDLDRQHHLVRVQGQERLEPSGARLSRYRFRQASH